MARAVKFKNNDYLDSTGIVHNQGLLSTLLESKTIHDRGSNSNGAYIRFKDGTMICYGYKGSLTYTPTDMWSWCDRTSALTVNFPISFVGTPLVSIASLTFTVIGTNINNVYTDRFLFYGFQPKNCGTTSMAIHYIAIGSWK